ncbi:MAG: chromosomal replication initiator protein [Chthoniobacter sp.]|jgi:chromosomal replication initiator protein|nr:chromosomal replication initiator protein [Chthoniobacter sp.]
MDKNLTLIWERISEVIAAGAGKETFERWFQSIELVAADETQLTLRVPNNIYQLWIESNYLQLVQAAVSDVLGAPRKLRFLVAAESDHAALPKCTPAARAKKPARSAAGLDDVHSLNGNGFPPLAPASNGMNPRNTFESFVVGANNQYAHAAGLAVAQSPSRTYNPLFIYGQVGLGKTHLMQAVGQHVASQGKSTKVMYLSSEKFTNEFIDAIQNNALIKFRKRYRQADVLLIDDIQFFAGKERSQEEFFHTFNTLFDGHKQIVLSSDRPPTEIANLEQRLVSRFEWGLTAELQPPDVETRVAILRKKASALNIKLPNALFDFLAQRIRTNVRRLEGALMRVASFASLSGKALDDETVEHLLKDILHEEARRSVTIDQIQKRVAEHFDIRLADMTSKRRPKNIAFPRQMAMYLARELTNASLAEIGEAFGGRDHGTVLHAHRLIQERSKSEEKTRQTLSFLDTQLHR